MVMHASAEAERQMIAPPPSQLDGVTYVAANGMAGTGALLYGGRAILTAAHVVTSANGQLVPLSSVEVRFQTASGTHWIKAEQIWVHPEYDPINVNHDLAIIWLQKAAPSDAPRYDLYRTQDELGKDFLFSGYGLTGTGWSGAQTESANTRHYAFNTFETTATQAKQHLGGLLGWTPQGNNQLWADFDNGRTTNDALGRLLGLWDSGLGNKEGLIAPGDSGGPAFISGKIAGLASYGVSLSTLTTHPDTDNLLNSSFGEIAAWQRVSIHQKSIDEEVRSHYQALGAPKSQAEVSKTVKEGDTGISYAWFWLSFHGEHDKPVSVYYHTVDGSAQAGLDYVPVSGRAVLYEGENHLAIPVEIIGDTQVEPDETFYLEISDPEGGILANGQDTLSAMRTIHDDDGWLI